MEVAGASERLADQARPDHDPVTGQQAAVGLVWENDLGDAGDREGIDQSGENGHQAEEHQSGADVLEHGGFS